MILKLLDKLNIKHICISNSLYHLKSNILNKYNLLEYQNDDNIETCLFFGVYDNKFNEYLLFSGKK